MSLGLADVRGTADARWSGAAEAGGENGVRDLGIEVVGVEVFTQPLASLGVLWMSRVGEDVEQLKVAPGAATILGRTPALSGGAGGTGQSLNDGQALFDQERMFPVVTEVVGVGEAGDARLDQAVQGEAFLVGDIVDGTRITVLPALDVEGVEMVAFPSHGGLDRPMQVTERRLTGNRSRRQTGGFVSRSVTLRLTAFRLTSLFGLAVLAITASCHHAPHRLRAACPILCAMGPWRASGFTQQSAGAVH